MMKNEGDQILYVGKANSLRHRVRSYFQPAKIHPPRIARMVEQVVKVDFITTASELEALALECNLIKEHRPKYNVRLRDDKQYPWLKVTWQEPFPRVYIVRRPQRDGARYYGPFTEAGALREILRLLRKIFPIRSCKRNLNPEERRRPCLNYHIGRCLAPCAGEVGEETYRQMIQDFCRILEGHTEQLEAKLKEEIDSCFPAGSMKKQRCTVISALYKVVQRQTVVSTRRPGCFRVGHDEGLLLYRCFRFAGGNSLVKRVFSSQTWLAKPRNSSGVFSSSTMMNWTTSPKR